MYQPRSIWTSRLFTGWLAVIAASPLGALAEDKISFNRDVRPILSANCFSCHGPDEEAREAKLRLDTRQGALADLGGYRALEPGKADKSELIHRIQSDDEDELMPPPDSGRKLTDKERRILREWINSGGEYETHWSLIAPLKAQLPKIERKGWPLHPLDHFILNQLEKNGMPPSPDADRYRWIRRVSLDLTGLPPTPGVADAFVADKDKDAYEKVVDRLLASTAYGEHWARMWLDLARYADTKGYEKDRHRDIWIFRDWVIDAFNRDMPYDQFTIEQLAGDLLPKPTPEQLVATAFHRNTMSNDEGGTDNEEFRVAAVKDRVDLTVQVWMGLTMGCAKCHSHKYDAITTEEYYRFYAYFNQTEDNDHSNDSPTYRVMPQESRSMHDTLKKELADQSARLEKAGQADLPDLLVWLKQQQPSGEEWKVFTPDKAVSRQGAKLAILADQSVLASGASPAKDEYIITGKLPPATYTTFRLDALTHSSLGNRAGPGRNAKDPNFVLTGITIEHIPAGSTTGRRLKIREGLADFQQKGWQLKGAYDGNAKTGWAISPGFGKDHLARFTLEAPLKIAPEDTLRISLSQQYGSQLCLGRIRLSAGQAGTEGRSLSELKTAMLVSLSGEELTPSRTQLAGELRSNSDSKTDALKQKLAALKAEISKLEKTTTTVPVMREKPVGKQRVTRIHKRGNFLSQGEKVQHGLPALFSAPPNLPKNRLGIARWLTAPENPLTARVMVNRIWARLFGVGIVETEEDFGSQGLLPSHPGLLDWLAVDLAERDWSIKDLLRAITLSRTYRQDSGISPASLAKDPRNRLLGRGPRFRLSAEVVRDQSLAASGLLTRKLGGPSVMPPQPPGIWKSTYSGEKWKTASGPDRYRRGLYTYLKRTSPHPAMITFDAGSGEVCQIRRIRTNTPLQALITLNDESYLEAAGALARVMEKSPGNLEQKIGFGFRKVLIRPAEPGELERLVRLYHELEEEIVDKGAFLSSAKLKEGDPSLVAVASVLLNLDEALMKP
jgi:hypothetical protein